MTDPIAPLMFHDTEPATLHVAGREIRLGIRRFTLDESAEYDRLFQRGLRREADRLILVRRPGEELARVTRPALSPDRVQSHRAAIVLLEQQRADDPGVVADAVLTLARQILDEVEPTETFEIGDEEIIRRRKLEMTDAERQNYERMKRADEQAFTTCVKAALPYVSVEPGQMTFVAGGQKTDVTTGEQLARCLGAQEGLLFALLIAIKEANRLGDVEKNDSGSPSTSKTSSDERDPTLTGTPPATAAAVAPPASVTSAAATTPATSPSGSATPA